jgi:outer membrane protein TolC
VAIIEDRIDQSERQVASAVTQLARWVGEAAKEPLSGAPATDSVPFAVEDLEARFAHHPEIEVLQRKEAIAQADADLAVADKRPDWSVGLTYGKRGQAYSDFVFLSLSVPLQWDQKNRQDREIAARLAAIEQLHAERGEATRGHVAETLTMLQEWQSNRRRLARYDATLVPLAAERSRAANAAYRGGSSGLVPLLEARRAEIDTRIEQMRLAMDTDRLWARLAYLIPASHAATGRP